VRLLRTQPINVIRIDLDRRHMKDIEEFFLYRDCSLEIKEKYCFIYLARGSVEEIYAGRSTGHMYESIIRLPSGEWFKKYTMLRLSGGDPIITVALIKEGQDGTNASASLPVGPLVAKTPGTDGCQPRGRMRRTVILHSEQTREDTH
jgi:hypothetical protein